MKIWIPVILSTLLLVGCTSEEEKRAQRDTINESLPVGCTFKDLGWYNNRPVHAVICKRTTTTDTTMKTSCGKNCYKDINIIVAEINEEGDD